MWFLSLLFGKLVYSSPCSQSSQGCALLPWTCVHLLCRFSRPFSSTNLVSSVRGHFLFLFFFSFLFFFERFYLFIFRESWRKGESEGEKHQQVVASCTPSTGDLAQNPGCVLIGNGTGHRLVHCLRSIHWATPARAGAFSWTISLIISSPLFIFFL